MTTTGGPRLLGLFLLALGLRVAFAHLTGALDVFPGECDEVLYDAPARTLAATGRLETTGEHPIGQVLVSAAVYGLAGPSTAAARLVSIVLSALTVVLVRILAAGVLPRAGAEACGVLAAVHPWLFYRAATVQTEVSALFLLCLACVLAGSPRPAGAARGVALGATLGLLFLVRPNALALVPAILLFGTTSRPATPVRELALATLVGLGLFAPWVAWTSREAGGFALGMGRAGQALHGSNCDRVWEEPALRGLWCEAPGPPVGEPGWNARPFGERDRIQGRLGWEWIRAHPGRFLGLAPYKLGRLLSLYRPFEGARTATRLAVVWSWGVLLLAGLGAWAVWRAGEPGWAPWGAWAAGVVGPCLLFHGANRFRYPLEPVLLVLAIRGGLAVYERLSRSRGDGGGAPPPPTHSR